MISLRCYVISSDEKLLQAARKGDKELYNLESAKDLKDGSEEELNIRLNGKTSCSMDNPLYIQRMRAWLKLQRETESLIITAQDQEIITNQIKAKIEKIQDNPECRMCHQANETTSYIVSGCAKLTLAEYKRRHDNVARAVHWDLTGKCGFQRGDKAFEHEPESVLEMATYKLM